MTVTVQQTDLISRYSGISFLLLFPLFVLRPPDSGLQIAREAEAAMFHRQLFEELFRLNVNNRDPADAMAMGAVEASFKCLAPALIVLTESGR